MLQPAPYMLTLSKLFCLPTILHSHKPQLWVNTEHCPKLKILQPQLSNPLSIFLDLTVLIVHDIHKRYMLSIHYT